MRGRSCCRSRPAPTAVIAARLGRGGIVRTPVPDGPGRKLPRIFPTPKFNTGRYSTTSKVCEYFYSVVARNDGGESEPSNVVGPLAVDCRMLGRVPRFSSLCDLQGGRSDGRQRNCLRCKKIVTGWRCGRVGRDVLREQPHQSLAGVFVYARDDADGSRCVARRQNLSTGSRSLAKRLPPIKSAHAFRRTAR